MSETPDYTATVRVRIKGHCIGSDEASAKIKRIMQWCLDRAPVDRDEDGAGEVLSVSNVWPVIVAPDPGSAEFADGHQYAQDVFGSSGMELGSLRARYILDELQGKPALTQRDYGLMHAATEALRKARLAAEGFGSADAQRGVLEQEDA